MCMGMRRTYEHDRQLRIAGQGLSKKDMEAAWKKSEAKAKLLATLSKSEVKRRRYD